MAQIEIDEALAGALLTMLRLVQVMPVQQMEADLLRACDNAGVDVIEVPTQIAVDDVLDDFPAGEV